MGVRVLLGAPSNSPKVLIVGGTGLVGSALARRFSTTHDVTALSRAALDVTDAAACARRVREERPTLVVNASVLGVDACEENPDLAHRVNAQGAATLARAAAESGAVLLHFSTNYVFDGRRDPERPYTIEEAPRPVNVYGRTKLEGEIAARELCPRTFVVRTSWVYGAGRETFLGSVHRKLRRGEGVKAIVDLFGNTTYAEDLAERIEAIVARGVAGVYHVVNEGVTTYEAFALEAARLVRLDGEAADRLVERVREGELTRKAPRPRSTPMRCLTSERLGLPPLRNWRDALAAWIAAARA